MISRDFLLEVLHSRGFSPGWIAKINSLVSNGSVGVRINDTNSDFFCQAEDLDRETLFPLSFLTWLLMCLLGCLLKLLAKF